MHPRLPTLLYLGTFVLAALLPALARPLPPRRAARMVEAARELIGIPYVFGGRLRGPDDGIDCQGVLFYAAERLGRCGWKSYSTKPTVSVRRAELGSALPGLDPIASADLEIASLRPGDVLVLVGHAENPAEPAIGALRGRPVWVWHTGLYSGEGRWIVGDHFAGQVVETDLRRYLIEHADSYTGLVVTRMRQEPRPRRCRHHPPMRAPLRATDPTP